MPFIANVSKDTYTEIILQHIRSVLYKPLSSAVQKTALRQLLFTESPQYKRNEEKAPHTETKLYEVLCVTFGIIASSGP